MCVIVLYLRLATIAEDHHGVVRAAFERLLDMPDAAVPPEYLVPPDADHGYVISYYNLLIR